MKFGKNGKLYCEIMQRYTGIGGRVFLKTKAGMKGPYIILNDFPISRCVKIAPTCSRLGNIKTVYIEDLSMSHHTVMRDAEGNQVKAGDEVWVVLPGTRVAWQKHVVGPRFVNGELRIGCKIPEGDNVRGDKPENVYKNRNDAAAVVSGFVTTSPVSTLIGPLSKIVKR
jgi:uncharacterized Zn ribbon protein